MKILTSIQRACMLAAFVGISTASAQPYEVNSAGNYGQATPAENSLAWALKKTDVVDEGVIFSGDINTAVWTNWAKATDGSLIFLPQSLDLGGSFLDIDLNSYTFGGIGLSLASKNGKLVMHDGVMDLASQNLYVGYHLAGNVELNDMTVNNAANIFIGKEKADYQGYLSLNNTTVNTHDITVVSPSSKDGSVQVEDQQASLSAKDSTINMNGGALKMSGEGLKVEGYPTNASGTPLKQERDAEGNLVYNGDGTPKIVTDSEGKPVTTTTGYYAQTGVLVNSDITGAASLTLEKGAALKLYGDSSIEVDYINVVGYGNTYTSELGGGGGTLLWNGDMDIEAGGLVDLRNLSVNGDAVRSLHLGKNGAQTLSITGGEEYLPPRATFGLPSANFI